MPNKKDLLNIEVNWREKYKLSKEEDFKIWLEKTCPFKKIEFPRRDI